MKRWLINHDDAGYHVREVLNVTHDENRGEAVYHTKPRGSRKSMKDALKLARKVERE